MLDEVYDVIVHFATEHKPLSRSSLFSSMYKPVWECVLGWQRIGIVHMLDDGIVGVVTCDGLLDVEWEETDAEEEEEFEGEDSESSATDT